MSTFRVIDSAGVWLLSKAVYPLTDPISITRFEPGQTVKATKTRWVDAQLEAKCLVEVDDPLKAANPPKQNTDKVPVAAPTQSQTKT